MSKHTAAPWECGTGFGMHGVNICGNDGNTPVCAVFNVDQDKYDKSGQKISSEPREEGWANARLIEAAPKLLAHLKFATKLLMGLPHVNGTAQLDAMLSTIEFIEGRP